MKNITIIVLTAVLAIGFAFSAQAGMNHQPHSVKTFMGKERKAVNNSGQEQRVKNKEKAHIKSYYKKMR